ncbi:transglutaminaseTgpA domain-containing protein [Dactylosporangium sp. NPDC006015]|uniref:DUF3488 and transglutaminase-like domain-containing protein n=1 Tax=Dactylosporangium sp. NPDC006015 TaxID=3154576 RepID=UPI0033BAF753
MTAPREAAPQTATPGKAALLDVLPGAVALAAVGVLYRDFFDGWGFLPAILSAVATPMTLMLVAVRLRWSGTVSTLLATVAFVPVAVLGALRDTIEHGVADTVMQLGWGVVGGWARLLTVPVPTTANGQPFVALLLSTWIAAAATGWLATRSTSVTAPLLPVLLAFGLNLAVVSVVPDRHLILAAVVATVAVVMVLARGTSPLAAVRDLEFGDETAAAGVRPTRRGIRWLGAGVLAVGASTVAIAAVATGLLGDGGTRSDPRPLEPAAVATPPVRSPLSMVKPQLRQRPPQLLFTVRPDVPRRDTYLRVAALDRFDGSVWTATDTYLVAGTILDRGAVPAGRTPVTLHIAVESLPSALLPVIGRPVRLASGPGTMEHLRFGPATGSLLSDRADAAHLSYDVAGYVVARTELPDTAAPTLNASPDPAALPPGFPHQIGVLSQRLALPEANPLAKLTAIERHLRGLPYNLDAPPGHSYAAVMRVLDPSVGTTGDGYAEQHAAAFALMGRSLGYRVRVAVGYHVAALSGTVPVTTADAHAWPEVYFQDYGWVPFEPTDTAQGPLPIQPATTPSLAPTVELSDPGPAQSVTQRPVDEPKRPQEPPRPDPSAVVIALGSAFTAALLAVPAAKARRRRRRRRALALAARVDGAWAEALDRLLERHHRFAAALTPHEIAVRAATPDAGTAALTRLGTAATMAMCAPGLVRAGHVEEAWAAERQLRQALYPGRRRMLLLVALLDPRPLLVRRPRGRWPG